MKTDIHLWATVDGRLVKAGDPAAATLKYAAGDEVADDDVEAAEALTAPEGTDGPDDSETGHKQAPRPADKHHKPGANKGRRR